MTSTKTPQTIQQYVNHKLFSGMSIYFLCGVSSDSPKVRPQSGSVVEGGEGTSDKPEYILRSSDGHDLQASFLW